MQARLDGFSLSRLKPYHRWETFSATARSLWDIYVSQLGPSRLRRVALRYLNRIELPLPFEDFGEYLTFVPDIPDGLPDAMSDFFLHLEIPDDPEESQAMILLNGTIIKDEAGDATLLPILLDIDIFQPFDTDVDQEAVWATLDVLRARKNAVFMACTTQKLRELIS